MEQSYDRMLVILTVLCVMTTNVASGVIQPLEFVWTKNTVSYNSSGRQLTGSVTATYYNAYLVTQCAFRCLQTTADQCASYNFLPAQRKCELNSASHVTKPDSLLLVAESQYFLRSAFSIDSVSFIVFYNNIIINLGLLERIQTLGYTNSIRLSLCPDRGNFNRQGSKYPEIAS